MMTMEQLRPLFEKALGDAGVLVIRAAATDLGRPTPCADWDLRALIGHMIGQNAGFAAAVRDGDAPPSAYAAPELGAGEIRPRWEESADRLRTAFREADPERVLRLAEFDREVTATTALGMQVLDCAVHAWDVAKALDEDYRPPPEVAETVLASARMIAARPGGTPGVFAAPVETGSTEAGDSADPWREALRLLGR
ncbi:TIGR03086 family metal-binding protein [Nocardioides sp. Iso805N]|uniref:TIGR03086 family metal-binding protein n=1 Tax=Nocardioides sp. Iso805N TaxID=1283287 RepID=UPI00037BB9D9|nr:TIGR03086 family metal-binding protein [Nocardioides sp. Iso805N]